MARALPPLTWFRAFDAAARHLSFTAAAEELGLTQSAVSQHIRALETRLGAPLFLRKPRGLALTDAGRRLVPDVAAALGRLRSATDAFGLAVGEDVLTVATSVSIAQWHIAPAMAEFQAAHPGIALRIITTVWPDDFSAAQAEVEIRFGPRGVVGKGAEPLGPNRIALVGAPALLRRGWQGLNEVPLIQPVGISETWDAVARSVGKDAPAVALHVDNHGLAVELACQGAGVALTSSLIAAPALADGRLAALPLPPVEMQEGYFLALNHTAGARGKAFSDWLCRRIAGYA